MPLISDNLAADLSPDASADALAIINIGKSQGKYDCCVTLPEMFFMCSTTTERREF